MNRQSNTYTVIYAVVLVAVVGVLLSVVYQALRPQQIENIENDTKRQILAAALITPAPGENVADLYGSHITDSFIVNANGDRVESGEKAFDVKVANEVKKSDVSQRLLPIFVCTTDNGLKYIVPVYGAGLWGPIWGIRRQRRHCLRSILRPSGGDPGTRSRNRETCIPRPIRREGHFRCRRSISGDKGRENRSGTRRRLRMGTRSERRNHHKPGRTEDAFKLIGTIHRLL